MGKLRVYPPVKYFAAITYAPTIHVREVLQALEDLFSPLDLRSDVFSFSYTDYYEPEMGAGLSKQFFSFQRLSPAESLPDFKIATNTIENRFAREGRRRVNIDPGYVCAAKVVLATTKDYDHRLYLGRGIFGDVHLRFRKGKFRINEWTYPDYRQEVVIGFFEQLRRRYLQQLQEWSLDLSV